MQGMAGDASIAATGADEICAHSPNGDGDWHLLADHLTSVALLAEQFAQSYGGQAAWLAGILHDVGKADPEWQAYLRAAAKGDDASRVDHKHAGVLALGDSPAEVRNIIGQLVIGHHGGLPHASAPDEYLDHGPTTGQKAAEMWANDVALLADFDFAVPRFAPEWLVAAGPRRRVLRSVELWVRMLFSALIDADRLDTEAHFRSDSAVIREQRERSSMAELVQRFHARRESAISARSDDIVADHRAKIFVNALKFAERERGWFTCTAPTGAGKTITGFGFALDHAARHDLSRVIVAVPFISVTEQVAAVARSLLGDEVVLEHHSGADIRENDSPTVRRVVERLSIENWDAEFIVTTTVQLLESLFDNRTSKVRKLHRLANSMIVLDEVQSIPWELLTPTIEVLRELVSNYGCSILLTTATQPPFRLVETFGDDASVELVDPSWFATFSRVRAVPYAKPVEWSSVADLVADGAEGNHDQAIVVVNTVHDARNLAAHLSGATGLVHLSTRLCMAHRRDVLNRVVSRLREDEPCLLVSTQLVEAGIDVDFPFGCRALGPLPSIVQVAGRVNRHGSKPSGDLVVFDPVDGKTPPGHYAIGTSISRGLINRGLDLLEPTTLDIYYDQLFDACEATLDKHNIQQQREHRNFPKVAELYQMIADDTTPVLVTYGDFDPAGLKVPDDPAQFRALVRRLQPYFVQLRSREFTAAVSDGRVQPVDDSRWLMRWVGHYDNFLGLQAEPTTEAQIW